MRSEQPNHRTIERSNALLPNGVAIDPLTPEQRRYLESWEMGI
ncbi:MAG TPA: hypothetical protein VIG69_02005 [Candidatus Methylomirabilis sp.]